VVVPVAVVVVAVVVPVALVGAVLVVPRVAGRPQ